MENNLMTRFNRLKEKVNLLIENYKQKAFIIPKIDDKNFNVIEYYFNFLIKKSFSEENLTNYIPYKYINTIDIKFISPKIFNIQTLKEKDIRLLGDLRYSNTFERKITHTREITSAIDTSSETFTYLVRGLDINLIGDNFDYNIDDLRNKIIFLYINLYESSNNKYYLAIKINNDNINKFKNIFTKKKIFINPSEETIFSNSSFTDSKEYTVKEIYVMVLEKI